MFKRHKKNSRRKPPVGRSLDAHARLRLLFEQLESRNMLSAVVAVEASSAGMELIGDGGAANVTVSVGPAAGEFTLTGASNTEFKIGPDEFATSLPLVGMFGPAEINLDNNATLTVEGANGGTGVFPDGLYIQNAAGLDSVTLQDLSIQGGVPISGEPPTVGTPALIVQDSKGNPGGDLVAGGNVTLGMTSVQIDQNGAALLLGAGVNQANLTSVTDNGPLNVLNSSSSDSDSADISFNSSTVLGKTDIDNAEDKDSGGNATVMINSSTFMGNFTLINNNGMSQTDGDGGGGTVFNAEGATSFGGTSLASKGSSSSSSSASTDEPGSLKTAVTIDNESSDGDDGLYGGANITFAPVTGGTVGPTINGSVSISNGATTPNIPNNVAFTDTLVQGGILIDNGATTAGAEPTGFSNSMVSFDLNGGTEAETIGQSYELGGIDVPIGPNQGVWSIGVFNGPGPGTVTMNGLTAPFGVEVYNGGSASSSTVSNIGTETTTIGSSTIGGYLAGYQTLHSPFDQSNLDHDCAGHRLVDRQQQRQRKRRQRVRWERADRRLRLPVQH